MSNEISAKKTIRKSMSVSEANSTKITVRKSGVSPARQSMTPPAKPPMVKSEAAVPQNPDSVPAPSLLQRDSSATSIREMRDVILLCMAQDAHCVSVAGSFNGWDTQAHPMTHVADATFQAILRLPPGEYRYKFVVDGEWMEDPAAKAQERNAHGTLDSILQV